MTKTYYCTSAAVNKYACKTYKMVYFASAQENGELGTDDEEHIKTDYFYVPCKGD